MEEQRIEFLEYLKKEFIEWWEERKRRKHIKEARKFNKRKYKRLRRELSDLQGKELAEFIITFLSYEILLTESYKDIIKEKAERSFNLMRIYDDYKERKDFGIFKDL